MTQQRGGAVSVSRRLILMLFILGLLPFGMSPATAQTAPPPGDISNFEFIRNIPMSSMTSINVLNYGNRDVLVAVGRFGVRTFDLTDPTNPEELDSLGNDVLRLPTDVPPSGAGSNTFWQSESTNVDQQRKLIFLSRDPRAYSGNQNNPNHRSGVYIIDARDPANLELILFHDIPAGHTSTCINDCQYLWTGGPALRDDMPRTWGGRPIFVTDIRDPNNPYTYPEPIDLGGNQGITDYAHDVQVDNAGVAWVSGRGYVRGYWTKGRHWDPVENRHRVATAFDPVPYAGGGGPDIWRATGPAVIHNSERPIDGMPGQRLGIGNRDSERPERPWASDGSDYAAHGFQPGELVYATHEDFNSNQCAGRGRFYIASLRGSYDGESWRATPDDPFRLEILSSWHPTDFPQQGVGPGNNCSGHYFRMKDGLVYMSWYGQGTRVLDVSDPYNPLQVAYFRPNGGSSYTTLPYKGLLFVADSSRGVDILRLDRPAAQAVAASGQEIVAPEISATALLAAADGLAPDPVMGWACPLPVE